MELYFFLFLMDQIKILDLLFSCRLLINIYIVQSSDDNPITQRWAVTQSQQSATNRHMRWLLRSSPASPLCNCTRWPYMGRVHKSLHQLWLSITFAARPRTTYRPAYTITHAAIESNGLSVLVSAVVVKGGARPFYTDATSNKVRRLCQSLAASTFTANIRAKEDD